MGRVTTTPGNPKKVIQTFGGLAKQNTGGNPHTESHTGSRSLAEKVDKARREADTIKRPENRWKLKMEQKSRKEITMKKQCTEKVKTKAYLGQHPLQEGWKLQEEDSIKKRRPARQNSNEQVETQNGTEIRRKEISLYGLL